MSIWNETCLKQPPLKAVVNKKISKETLKTSKEILENALKFYKNQINFDESAALCSRLIARRKNSFKKMHGFKALVKLNSALCRLLRIDIKNNLSNLIGILPEYYSCTNQIPTRSNIDYVLIKIIGLHKLFKRIISCSEESAKYFKQLVSNLHFVDTIVLLLAVLSDIWSRSKEIIIYTATLYEHLLKYRTQFPIGNKNLIMFDNFQFPDKLDSIESFESKEDIKETKEHEKIICTLTVDKQNIKFKDFSEKFKPTKRTKDIEMFVNCNPDNNLNITHIRTSQEIQVFLLEEEKQRKKLPKKCISKKIPDNNWKKATREILKLIGEKDNKNAVKLFKYLIKNKI